ncbi:hypothetical protein MEX01_39660 [Methylorubrum extorquens]|uniref:hypothetical protein n=1 Tax=Methylorubrum extorquens TaxID=408 RepID=UPI001171C08C|nr:hypothetical protein [Methylorubrum extorquens]GEL43375.1 hypothetical protein MEX01_39660 [Methylorubrum extorquens]
MHAAVVRRTMLCDDLPAAVDARRAEAEAIAELYLSAYRGNERAALVAAIADALAELAAADQRTEAVRRQVSRGYVRGRRGRAGR